MGSDPRRLLLINLTMAADATTLACIRNRSDELAVVNGCRFDPGTRRGRCRRATKDFAFQRGNVLFDYHRTLGSEVGGTLKIFDADPSITVVPTFGARGITSGGTIAQADFERLARELLDAVRQAGSV